MMPSPSWNSYMDFEILTGKTLTKCERDGRYENDAIRFETTDGDTYVLTHVQDCCESVGIEDIDGNFEDMIGSPILYAEVSTGDDPAPSESAYDDEFGSWTFYRIQTAKGFMMIRWFGSSEYYSTAVNFYKE